MSRREYPTVGLAHKKAHIWKFHDILVLLLYFRFTPFRKTFWPGAFFVRTEGHFVQAILCPGVVWGQVCSSLYEDRAWDVFFLSRDPHIGTSYRYKARGWQKRVLVRSIMWFLQQLLSNTEKQQKHMPTCYLQLTVALLKLSSMTCATHNIKQLRSDM